MQKNNSFFVGLIGVDSPSASLGLLTVGYSQPSCAMCPELPSTHIGPAPVVISISFNEL